MVKYVDVQMDAVESPLKSTYRLLVIGLSCSFCAPASLLPTFFASVRAKPGHERFLLIEFWNSKR